jgi:uncharacterized membrane protein
VTSFKQRLLNSPDFTAIMQIFKKIGESILFGGIFFLLFIVAFEQKLHLPLWLKVVGRMHPVFLHFPIVLLLLSFFTLWLPLKNEHDPWLNILRLVAALAATITAIMGLLLSLEEDESSSGLQWHKWFGVGVALLGFAFYYSHRYFSKKKLAGKSFTVVAGIGIILTGHLGANVTHGDNYLLAPVTSKKKIVPLDKAVVYDDVLKPILEEKCGSCHGESSMKGGLALTNIAAMLKGGKTGPLFIAGQASSSLLIKRIHLPLDDKYRMPPKSKAQLTDDEAALLYAWIESGAPLNQKLNSLPATDTFKMLAARYLFPSTNSTDAKVYDFSAASENEIKSLNTNYRVVQPQGIGSPALAVNFFGKGSYTSKQLEDLLKIKQQITELSLARMPVKDNEMKVVQQMVNLEKLNLNYTDITDAGLEQLTGLKKLQELSLSGTKVTQKGLKKILALPLLEALFIWNTNIDSTQVAVLSNTSKKVKIEKGFVDNGQIILALSPPMLKRPGGVFNDTTTIELRHPFKGVTIRYTLDGSSPDSIKGLLYKEPIRINDDTKLIARAFKKGWYGSDSMEVLYFKRAYKPDSTEFITLPDPKYSITKADILSDGDFGDMNPDNGKWLGYTKNDAVYFLHFNNAVIMHRVLLNMLKDIGRHSFPPASIEVWGGMDKKHLKPLVKLNPKMPAKNESSSMIQANLAFPPTQLKILKIVAKPIQAPPKWYETKSAGGWIFINEIVVN